MTKSKKKNTKPQKSTKSKLAQKNEAKRKKEARRKKAAAANAPRKVRVSDEDVRAMIVMLCAASYPEGTVRPEDVAMELNPMEWQSLLKRIRLLARQMAQAGTIDILRKGEPVDPDDFKGVYRLRVTEAYIEGLLLDDGDEEE